MYTNPDKMEKINQLSNKLIGLVFNCYNSIGHGFSEKVYQNIYSELLNQNNIVFQKEKYAKLLKFGKVVGRYRVDFLVENSIVVELKCRKEIYTKDIAQVLNYLKTNNVKLGLIFCFTKKNVLIKRLLN